jgi:molybdopterin converting factor small subunit
MRIKVHFHGILADWVGIAEAEIELPEKSMLSDLLSLIRKDFGKNLPPALKGKDQEEFQKAFWAVRGSTPISDPATELNDGEEIRFFLPLAGG